MDPNGHPQELGFGPDVGVELDFLAEALCVERRYCRREDWQDVKCIYSLQKHYMIQSWNIVSDGQNYLASNRESCVCVGKWLLTLTGGMVRDLLCHKLHAVTTTPRHWTLRHRFLEGDGGLKDAKTKREIKATGCYILVIY